jgi:hypothetical protein
MRVIIFFLSLVLSSFTLKTYIPDEDKDTIWLYLTFPDKKIDYYIEVEIDGHVIFRSVEKWKSILREGRIKRVYVKDFFRETKNSDLMRYSRNIDLSKTLFFKGELIKISANIDGEIRRIISPLNSFSNTFVYALRQVISEAEKLDVKNYSSFITAIPLEGETYVNYLKKVPSGYKLPIIETREVKKNKFIFKAINYPFRLIPLSTKEDEASISDFINKYNLYGTLSSFYIGTTRGNYQISIIK